MTFKEIDNVLKDYCSLDTIQIKTRRREVVYWRQLAHYFARELTAYSLAKIGRYYGDKDHATVIHSHRVIGNLCQVDKAIRKQVEEIKERILFVSGYYLEAIPQL